MQMETKELISAIKKLNIPGNLKENLIKNLDNIKQENLLKILEKYWDNIDLIKQADIRIINQFKTVLNNLNEEVDKQNIKIEI